MFGSFSDSATLGEVVIMQTSYRRSADVEGVRMNLITEETESQVK